MRFAVRVFAAFLFFFFLSIGTAVAQTGPQALDARPYSPHTVFGIDAVSAYNGSLNLNVPLWSAPQRGGKLELAFFLRYDSPNYSLDYQCDTGLTPPGDPPGDSAVLQSRSGGGVQPNWLPPSGSCPYPECPPDGNYFTGCTTNWNLNTTGIWSDPEGLGNGVSVTSSLSIMVEFVDPLGFKITTPDGGGHQLVQTSSGIWRDTEGLGWTYDQAACTAQNAAGVRWVFTCEQPSGFALYLPVRQAYVEDPNGNRITAQYDSNGRFSSWIDTFGRTIPMPQIDATIDPACTEKSLSWQLPDITGKFVFCVNSVGYHTDFWASDSYAVDNSAYHEAVGTFSMMTKMVTPSAETWTFDYTPLPGDQYYGTSVNFAELRSIGLPTGGFLHYHWQHTTNLCGVTPQSLSRSFLYQRDELPSAGGPAHEWGYSPSLALNSTGQPNDVTVSDPLGNVTLYKMHLYGYSCGFFPYQIVYENAFGQALKTEQKDYLLLSPSSDLSQAGTGVVPTLEKTIWPDGSSLEKDTAYGWTFSGKDGSSWTPIDFGIQQSSSETETLADSTVVPVRSETLHYKAQDTGSPYLGLNLLHLLSTDTVTDLQSSRQQLTTYSYDDFSLSSGGASSPGWNATPPNGAYRGNLTQVSRYSVEAAANLTTKLTYNDTGTIASLALPVNDPYPNTSTSYQWSSTYQGGLLTGVTDSLGHTSSYVYDAGTLRMSSRVGLNGETTNFDYYAGDGRLQKVTLPADVGGSRGETDYAYPSPTEVDTSTEQSSGVWVQHKEYFDGLGRSIETLLSGGCGSSGDIVSETSYDSLNRVLSQSNEHCNGAASNTDGTTHHGSWNGTAWVGGYDGLGRPLVVTLPDGNTQQWTYNGNIVTSTDERGSQWVRTTDPLGRLTDVIEPGGAHTNYQYDAFDNLTQVTQAGVGTEISRIRWFEYDSLNRLLSAYNPESGLTCYGSPTGMAHSTTAFACTDGYDAHGNLLAKTDANSVQTLYSYDALNRNTAESASDGSLSNAYTYDLGANGIGRISLTQSNPSDGSGLNTASFSYDALGRVISSGTLVRSLLTHWSQAVSYDLAGHPVNLTYPDGRVIHQAYDAMGRLATVTDATPGGAGTVYFAPTSGQAQYTPAGALATATYGNGVMESFAFNSRLQPCRAWASTPVLAAVSGGGNVFDRQSFYNDPLSTPPPSPCGAEAGNNGNVHVIADNRNVGWTQSFGYDALNRLHTASRSDAGYSHIYNYDSFGNMILQDTLHTNVTWDRDPATNQLLRRPVAGMTDSYGHPLNDYTYDYAGHLISTGTSDIAGHAYSYNALGQINSVDEGAYIYGYDAAGNRVAKVGPGGLTAYAYLNSQVMAEVSENHWTDYVYANGQKIAKIASSVPLWHVHGSPTAQQPTGCGAVWYLNNPLATLSDYTVSSGDRLVADIRTSASAQALFGLYSSAAGSYYGSWIDSDEVSGQPMYSYQQSDGVFHHTITDLTSYAGNTMLSIWVGSQTNSSDWDVWLANVAIVRANGSIIPVFNGQDVSATIVAPCNESDLTFATEPTSTIDPAVATSYYLGDHLGTTQMEISSGGWPVWQGQFTPFGAELPDGSTAMRYKFTGKERDAESGRDYFGARYYASSMGRWMSPDWAAKATPVPYAKLENPQSLNLYSYVGNNPLSKADLDGHCVEDFCIFEGAAVVAFAESPAGQQLEAEAEEVAERYSGQIEAGLSRAGSWAGAQLARAGNFLEEQAQKFSGTPKNTERILQGEANGANYRVPDLMVKVGEKTAAIGEVKDTAKLGNSKQLTDLMGAAKDAGAKFSLFLGEKTQLTKPLATQLYNSGAAVYRYTNGKFVDITKTLKPAQ